jgi:hypothetical protein
LEKREVLKQICVTEEYLKENNIELMLVPYTLGLSTSQVIDIIKANDFVTDSKIIEATWLSE